MNEALSLTMKTLICTKSETMMRMSINNGFFLVEGLLNCLLIAADEEEGISNWLMRLIEPET